MSASDSQASQAMETELARLLSAVSSLQERMKTKQKEVDWAPKKMPPKQPKPAQQPEDSNPSPDTELPAASAKPKARQKPLKAVRPYWDDDALSLTKEPKSKKKSKTREESNTNVDGASTSKEPKSKKKSKTSKESNSNVDGTSTSKEPKSKKKSKTVLTAASVAPAQEEVAESSAAKKSKSKKKKETTYEREKRLAIERSLEQTYTSPQDLVPSVAEVAPKRVPTSKRPRKPQTFASKMAAFPIESRSGHVAPTCDILASDLSFTHLVSELKRVFPADLVNDVHVSPAPESIEFEIRIEESGHAIVDDVASSQSSFHIPGELSKGYACPSLGWFHAVLWIQEEIHENIEYFYASHLCTAKRLTEMMQSPPDLVGNAVSKLMGNMGVDKVNAAGEKKTRQHLEYLFNRANMGSWDKWFLQPSRFNHFTERYKLCFSFPYDLENAERVQRIRRLCFGEGDELVFADNNFFVSINIKELLSAPSFIAPAPEAAVAESEVRQATIESSSPTLVSDADVDDNSAMEIDQSSTATVVDTIPDSSANAHVLGCPVQKMVIELQHGRASFPYRTPADPSFNLFPHLIGPGNIPAMGTGNMTYGVVEVASPAPTVSADASGKEMDDPVSDGSSPVLDLFTSSTESRPSIGDKRSSTEAQLEERPKSPPPQPAKEPIATISIVAAPAVVEAAVAPAQESVLSLLPAVEVVTEPALPVFSVRDEQFNNHMDDGPDFEAPECSQPEDSGPCLLSEIVAEAVHASSSLAFPAPVLPAAGKIREPKLVYPMLNVTPEHFMLFSQASMLVENVSIPSMHFDIIQFLLKSDTPEFLREDITRLSCWPPPTWATSQGQQLFDIFCVFFVSFNAREVATGQVSNWTRACVWKDNQLVPYDGTMLESHGHLHKMLPWIYSEGTKAVCDNLLQFGSLHAPPSVPTVVAPPVRKGTRGRAPGSTKPQAMIRDSLQHTNESMQRLQFQKAFNRPTLSNGEFLASNLTRPFSSRELDTRPTVNFFARAAASLGVLSERQQNTFLKAFQDTNTLFANALSSAGFDPCGLDNL